MTRALNHRSRGGNSVAVAGIGLSLPIRAFGGILPRTDIPVVVASYDDFIIKLYGTFRFRIFRQKFLNVIEQYLPTTGSALDFGAGVGLSSLYFALRSPSIQFFGLDPNPNRVFAARKVAART